MKIIHIPVVHHDALKSPDRPEIERAKPEATEKRAAASVPAIDMDQVKAYFQNFKSETLAEFEALEKRLQPVPAPDPAALARATEKIMVLSAEVTALRKAVDDLSKAAPVQIPAAPSVDAERVKQAIQEIARLSSEVAALRKAVDEMPKAVAPVQQVPVPPMPVAPTREAKPEIKKGPLPEKMPEPHPELKREPAVPVVPLSGDKETTTLNALRDAMAGSPSSTVDGETKPPSERKVAFPKKLWDYLNQVAFEIPPRKSDRTL